MPFHHTTSLQITAFNSTMLRKAVTLKGRVDTMVKTGLSILVLIAMSGCATIIGDKPEQTDQASIEQSRNAQLKTEAAALREAVQQKRDELNQLQPGTSE